MSYPQVGAAKRLSFLSSLLFSVLLVGCGSDSDSDNTSSSSSSVSSSSSSLSSSSSSSSTAAAVWPDITITATRAKTLNIYWDSVPDATFYRLLKDPDGASGFTQLGDDYTTTEATDSISVHLYNWQNARYMVEACNADGCSNSNEAGALQAMLDAIGYVKASNTNALDWFGWSLALSADGSTLAVSATQEDSIAQGINGDEANNAGHAPGAVYIYSLESGIWSQQAYLKASNNEQLVEDDDGNLFVRPNDRFGYSLSLSDTGNTLAVSAMLEDSNATGIDGDESDNSAADAGAVYMFERNDNAWLQTAYIKASNTPEEESDNNSNDNSDDGVCIEDEATEEIECEEEIALLSAGDRFGYTVVLAGDGNTLAVGAIHESSNATGINGDQTNNAMDNAGATYVFIRTEQSWVQQAYIKSASTLDRDLFGSSISLSTDGNTLAVGASHERRNGTGINNAVSTSLSSNSGAAFVFRRQEAQWSQQAYIKTTYTETNQYFGFSLSLAGDGNTLAIGAYGEGSKAIGIDGDPSDYADPAVDAFPYTDSGAVYIFTFDTDADAWQQTTYIKASNREPSDRFGRHLALSNDGMYLAVGAYFEDSAALGINGDQDNNNSPNAGAVYLFSNTGSTWQQDRYIKSKASNNNDRFGQNVAISANGSTLAISAYREASDAIGLEGDAWNNDAAAAGAAYLY